MEKEDLFLEQEEETDLLLRNSRNTKIKGESPDLEVINGDSESNGHVVEPEVTANGSEGKIEEDPYRVLEVATNGKSIPEEIKSEAIKEEQKEGNLVEGAESSYAYPDEKKILKDPGQNRIDISSLDFVVQNGSTSAIKSTLKEDPENGGVNSSIPEPSHTSFEDQNGSYKSFREIESIDVDLINGDDLEVTDLDVEGVLKKQTTHDLYCPNCNSCITKRVILLKRKRRIHGDDEIKPKKKEATDAPILSSSSLRSPSDPVHPINEVTQQQRADENEISRGPDIFKCLSCFTFFIPIGNKLKLIFGGKEGPENVQSEQTPNIEKDRANTMSAIYEHAMAADQGSSTQTDLGTMDAGNISSLKKSIPPSSEGIVGRPENIDVLAPGDEISPSLNGVTTVTAEDDLDTVATKTVDARIDQFDLYTEDQITESKVNQEVQIVPENGPSVATFPLRSEDANGESNRDLVFSSNQGGGLKFLVSPHKVSQINEDSIQNQTKQSGPAASDMNGKPVRVPSPHGEQYGNAIPAKHVLEDQNAKSSGSVIYPFPLPGQVYPPEEPQNINTKVKLEIRSRGPVKVDDISCSAPDKDAVIDMDSLPAESSHIMQGTANTAHLSEPLIAGRERSEERKEFEIEVVKSIVYGGLAESITSLSVVSSAAGGAAATLNILAIGMANLIGGLFIICHNLWELKNESALEAQVANQVSSGTIDQRNRYRELLGRRQNFAMHAIIAIISYLIFGSVPPIAYGFSFRKTDDKQMKIVLMGAVSIACIVALAIGKAYTQRRPKPYLKTVVTFVMLGFMVSGVSYAAGELVERVLEKYGVFQTGGSVPNLIRPTKGVSNAAE